MARALINIDYTNDFVAANGKLTCGKSGQNIEDRITEITQQFMDRGEFVVFGIDLHHEGDTLHPESRLFPPHNIQHTSGRELYGKLGLLYQQHKDSAHVYWMDKTRYSAFAGTDLELQLRTRGITQLHFVGVCTDICVLHTVIDAYNKGFDLVIHQDGVASFNDKGHVWALEHFRNTLGAQLA